jgi:hypothetical protein
MDDHGGVDARLQGVPDGISHDPVQDLIKEVARLRDEIAALQRDLAALSDYQASCDRLLALDGAQAALARLPRFVVIEPDQLLRPQDGFYGVEHTVDNIPFRWTGPSTRFSFNLFIDRTHGADLRLDALSCIDFGLQGKIRLVVDGESVPVTVNPRESGFIVLAHLPERSGTSNTNLVFLLPAVLVPPKSTDERQLGIAFGHLSVTACAAGSSGGRGDASGTAQDVSGASPSRITGATAT